MLLVNVYIMLSLLIPPLTVTDTHLYMFIWSCILYCMDRD